MELIYDVAIIGSGVAGMSLALYLNRAGINNIIIEKSAPGGQLNKIINLENYPGIPSIDGPTFAGNLYDQITNLGTNYIYDEVLNIKSTGKYKKITTKNNIVKAKYVVIATGRHPRPIELPNASTIIGSGISYCALCDGAFYKNKSVAVLGSGRSAVEEALYLSNICNQVTIICRKDKINVEKINLDKILTKNNINILYNSNITKLNIKENYLKSIIINDAETLPVEGLFIAIGYIPNSDFISNIKKDNGYIIVNKNYETSSKKIFAIGDSIKKAPYQVLSSAYDALILSNYITNKLK